MNDSKETAKVESKLKLSPAEIVEQLKGYHQQAEQSLTQLQTDIDTLTKQLDERKRMQLIVLGQKQVVVDLLSKLVESSPK